MGVRHGSKRYPHSGAAVPTLGPDAAGRGRTRCDRPDASRRSRILPARRVAHWAIGTPTGRRRSSQGVTGGSPGVDGKAGSSGFSGVEWTNKGWLKQYVCHVGSCPVAVVRRSLLRCTRSGAVPACHVA
ncbi:unnamed protein product [[Actinomadura] parvosata subsp. kistnae]|nr:unnamed protein product [Actinomadura parvosata subsp. kistnae]